MEALFVESDDSLEGEVGQNEERVTTQGESGEEKKERGVDVRREGVADGRGEETLVVHEEEGVDG